MQSRPNPINRHKLARLVAWGQLLLVWWVPRVAAWALQGRPITRRELDRVARALQPLMVARVMARMPVLQRSRNRHGRLKHYTRRTLAGAYFRRLTRGRTWAERIFALLAFMRDAKRHIARQLKRLRRGLTRLRVILPRAEACALPALPACAVLASDTS
jgi:hypothetical protein